VAPETTVRHRLTINVMKMSEHDESLRQLLAQWKIKESLPPRFQESVWRRVQAEELRHRRGLWNRLLNSLEATFSQPAMAVSYATVFLVAGLVAGSWQGHQANDGLRAELGMRYIRSVDPYQAPRPISR